MVASSRALFLQAAAEMGGWGVPKIGCLMGSKLKGLLLFGGVDSGCLITL